MASTIAQGELEATEQSLLGTGIRKQHKVLSVDTHVGEPPELYERLPVKYREKAPRVEERDGVRYLIADGLFPFPFSERDLTDYDLEHEFRRDKSQGRDIQERMKAQAQDGVDAEVVFPNSGLVLTASPDSGYQMAVAKAYNDWVWELFRPYPQRFAPAAIIPMADIAAAIEEAVRVAKLGLRSLLLPVSIPWRPYRLPEYEPFWSAVEELEIPLNFHVFTGNLGQSADFAEVRLIDGAFLEEQKRTQGQEFRERLSTTVIGMAAGMGPIVHLTGAGVLERHPKLKFAIIESDIGWLAWVLHAMDDMQRRRHTNLPKLDLLPSEYFKRQGYVSFSDDPVGLANIKFTGADCLMWANDYPHDEGTYLESQKVIEETFVGVSAEDKRKILWENGARLYGFPLD